MDDTTDIGFVEECDPWRLESRFFPSKVGGKPAWLSFKGVPDKEQLACDYCQDPCIFLCQVYAPYEESDDAFHRTIYIFICKNPACCKENCNGNLKVIRSQLGRVNEFYPSDPPIEEENWRPDLCIEKWSKVCEVCGISSTSHCSKCKKVNYCCRTHQIWDWKKGHKQHCSSAQELHFNKDRLMTFPEFELVIEKECEESGSHTGSDTENELQKLDELVKSGKAGSLQADTDVDGDLLRMASDVEDKVFSKFKKKIKSEPDQVLRYNRGGNPLFISSENQPSEIPQCENCGGDRQFEFQVMPQLLVHLQLENILVNIDWGILAVYTCIRSCTSQSQTKYIQEYVWKQDIVKTNC
ncbi:hypothetical protein QAD02_022490 [Eretmocerus hayati]|uniref:Uncharacterized protein n=1 Tax=Eretmocerus hayati TaxID=131215 RepID=A0ACC2PV87_9HYME|nr:hypothetical protein QAD02_022490 [Eretmocerus hayati]